MKIIARPSKAYQRQIRGIRRFDSRSLRIIAAGLFALGVSFWSTASAIHPDNHLQVTRVAFETYADCVAKAGAKNHLHDGIEAIVFFSAEEDLSPYFKRLMNWHFYDAYRNDEAHAMGRFFIGARMSMHHVFDERADELAAALADDDRKRVYELTGRLLHYMQDVTIPAHVAPIFHYDAYFIDRSDYFDLMPEWQTHSVKADQGICDVSDFESVDLKQRLNSILTKTALQTRARIDQPISISGADDLSGKTWQEFWVLRDPADDDKYKSTIKGFAPYGNQGRHGYEQLCDGSDEERRACLDFFERSYADAVSATVETLLMINALLDDS